MPKNVTTLRVFVASPGDATRVVRGGAWNLGQNPACCACRFRDDPDDGYGLNGFRVVADAS